jgi:hypothetical protein
VLAGYFSKLLVSLIQRKQNQMVPYLFNADNDAIDCLIDHVYQKSVSEVLIKIMNIEENNFNEDLSEAIHKRKIAVITKLVNKLDIDNEE